MTRKNRLVILFVCMVCFFIGAAILIPYSIGYRFDFEKNKIVATGGIYIKSFPLASKITIDSDILERPTMFLNSIFVQGLLPKDHSVLVQKSNYYDYFKIVPVQEKEVTRLENILLFRKDMAFSVAPEPSGKTNAIESPFDKQEKFVIKNNNLYYSDIAENAKLTKLQKSTPVIKNLVAFATTDNNIIWLSTDGLLYQSNVNDLLNQKENLQQLTTTALKINKKAAYKIVASGQNILLNNDGIMLVLNHVRNDFENFPVTATYKKISDCQWLNDYYVVFATEGKIIISETDLRGNVNVVTLPQTIELPGDPANRAIEIIDPQIFFNQQEGKLYILTNNTLLVSEKLTP